MALDLTVQKPVFLGVPQIASEHADCWVSANCSHGPSSQASNLVGANLRYLRRPATFRANAGVKRRIAFGFWSAAGGFDLPLDGTEFMEFSGYALCRNTFFSSCTARLRNISPGPYWIEHDCPVNAGTGELVFNSVAKTRANATGTMEFLIWIRPSTIDATVRGIAGLALGGATQYPWQLSILSGGSNPKLRFHYTHSGGTAASVDSAESAALAVDTWANVGFTISGTTLTWYVNGASIGTSVLAAATRDATNGTASVFRGTGGYFLGRLSDMRIWSGAAPTPTATKIHHMLGSTNDPDFAMLSLWFPLWNGAVGTEYSHALADVALLDATSAALTYTATLTLSTRLGSGGTITDFGTVSPYSGLSAAVFIDRPHDIWHLQTDPIVNPGSFQIDIDDPSGVVVNPNPTSIGALIVGAARQPELLSPPYGVGPVDQSEITVLPGGQLFAYRRGKHRTQTITFEHIDTQVAMISVFEEMLMTMGNTEPFFFIADPSSRTYTIMQSMLARFASVQQVTGDGRLWAVNAQLEEIR